MVSTSWAAGSGVDDDDDDGGVNVHEMKRMMFLS
jgi:hypothetical protein